MYSYRLFNKRHICCIAMNIYFRVFRFPDRCSGIPLLFEFDVQVTVHPDKFL